MNNLKPIIHYCSNGIFYSLFSLLPFFYKLYIIFSLFICYTIKVSHILNENEKK